METITLAGGCFWCTEAIFKRLKGVDSVEPGFAGGTVVNPSYEQVSSGQTGHAEAIQIKYDPKIISLTKILDIFWATHNPTTLNQQGNDRGTEYRSAIFYHTSQQRTEAEKSKAKLVKTGSYSDPIVTEIVPFENFYLAEDYHKNYYDKNKNSLYCDFVISPKIHKLLTRFAKDVKPEYQTS
jgi:peptide-methionine (S)-S-oxide reductase